MKLIVIWRVCLNRDSKRIRSKLSYAILKKWIFENFGGPFYDDVNGRDKWNLIKALGL